MAFEYLNNIRDPLYPIGRNQDERILIEYNGILHSEAEEIFYGMKDCPIMEAHEFSTYQRLLTYNPEKVYEEIGYFRPRDLVLYLNDGNEIDEGEINAIIEYAKLNYDYSISTTTNMLGAIESLIKADYIKGITIVVPKDDKKALFYLTTILNNNCLNIKASLLEIDTDDSVIDKMKEELITGINSNTNYTTIITNEYQLIIDVLKDFKIYHAETMLFLLRNHSQNMEQMFKGESIHFNELHNDEITKMINGDPSDPKFNITEFPVKAKFGRFTPAPFKTDSPTFMTFGDNANNFQTNKGG